MYTAFHVSHGHRVQGSHHSGRLRRIGIGVIAFLAMTCYVPFSFAEAKALSPAVRDALEANAKAIFPLEIVWTFSRSSELPPLQLMTRLGYPESARVTFFENVKVEYVAQDGMVYSTREFSRFDDKTEMMQSRVEELSFNLEKYFNGTGLTHSQAQNKKAMLAIRSAQKGAGADPYKVIIPAPYFGLAGFAVSETWRDLSERKAAQSLLLQLIDKEYLDVVVEKTVDLNGKSVLQIGLSGSERDYHFFVDPELNYGVVRRDELTKKGEVALRVENSKFEKVQGRELWLPQTSLVHRFSSNSEPNVVSSDELYSEQVEVTLMNGERKSVDRFALDYSSVPGTRIVDDTHISGQKTVDGEVSYEVPGSANQIDQAINKYVESRRAEQEGIAPPKKAGRVSLLIVNAICLAALVIFLIVRRVVRSMKNGSVS